MDWFAKIFIRASLIWFVLGITLGLAMAVHPAWVVYRPAHAHMNLVGFVTMMIFGVGYQMLPRFFGHPIHSRNFVGDWRLRVRLKHVAHFRRRRETPTPQRTTPRFPKASNLGLSWAAQGVVGGKGRPNVAAVPQLCTKATTS